MGEWVGQAGPAQWEQLVGVSGCRTLDIGAAAVTGKHRLLEGEMVGLRWALRRLSQQGIVKTSRVLSKKESKLVAREYSSAGRGIGIWGACFDGGQPHQVLTFENEN